MTTRAPFNRVPQDYYRTIAMETVSAAVGFPQVAGRLLIFPMQSNRPLVRKTVGRAVVSVAGPYRARIGCPPRCTPWLP